MERIAVIFGIVAVYSIVATLVGAWSIKYTKDTPKFMTAKSQMGPLIIGILMMSEFIGTGATLGTAQVAYESGIFAAWNVVSLGLGFLLYAYWFGPKFNSIGEYTISGALARKYGDTVRVLVSLTMIYALITVNVSLYAGGAAIVSSLLKIPIGAATYFIGIATILNLALGGIRGVGYANIIHASCKYIGLITVAITGACLLNDNTGSLAKIPDTNFSYSKVGIPTLLAWTIGNFGAVISTQYVIQCISSLTSPADAKKAAIVSSITIIPIGIVAAFIGVAAKALFPDIKSIMAFPVFFDSMNPWLAGIAVASVVATTFVSILACQLGATALIVKDFYEPFVKSDEQKRIIATRIIAVILGLLPIPFALGVPALLKTVFFARALRTTVAVIAVFMFYLPQIGGRKSAAGGLVCSLVGTTIWFVMGDPWGIDNIYVAAVIPALAMLIEHFWLGKRSAKNT